jgi:hypothetical protein
MSKEPAKRHDEAKADEPEIDYSKGAYHGLSEEQIKKIEDARHDDSEGVPPPVSLPPDPPPEADAEARRKVKADEDEAEKKRKAK